MYFDITLIEGQIKLALVSLKVRDNVWFIVPVLLSKLSIVWVIFDKSTLNFQVVVWA
jgi:hypothetical protein